MVAYRLRGLLTTACSADVTLGTGLIGGLCQHRNVICACVLQAVNWAECCLTAVAHDVDTGWNALAIV